MIINIENFTMSESELLNIDDLRIDRDHPLGHGISGTVFPCSYRGSLNIYAVKELKSTDQRVLKEFFHELKMNQFIKSKGGSANIVNFYGGVDKPKQLLLFDLMKGNSLEKFLFHDGNCKNWRTDKQDFQKLIEMFIGCSSGLVALHSWNLIHRDIACRNFLFDTHRNRPLVFDLGLVGHLKNLEYVVSALHD